MITSLNVNNTENLPVFNQGAQALFPNKGIVNATVLGKNQNNFLLEIIETGLKFNAQLSTDDPNIGDILQFEVIPGGDSTTLKLLSKSVAPRGANQLNSDDIISLYKQSNFIKDIDTNEKYDSSKIEKERAIAALKKRLNSETQNVTLTAVNKLMSSGIPISQIDIINLQPTLNEIEPQLTQAPSNIENHIKETLDAHSLPLSSENITKLQNAADYFIKSNTEETIVNTIKNGPLTLGNLYKSSYSSSKNEKPKYEKSTSPYIKDHVLYQPTSTSLKNDTQQQIPNFEQELLKLFTNQDIEQSPSNLEYGKLLYKNDVPITKKNIETIETVKNTGISYILNKSAQCILDNTPIADIMLEGAPKESLYSSYSKLLSELPNISQKHIDNVVSQGKPVTLYNLQNERLLGSAPTTLKTDADNPSIKSALPKINLNDQKQPDITYRRNLAEIQLKLTYEAAYRLANKNIDINTMPLHQAVEEIRLLEKEHYAKILNNNTLGNQSNQVYNINSPQVETMAKVYDAIKNISYFMPMVYKGITENNDQFTLSAVDNATIAQKQALGYEQFMTVPNAKYGDSFAKVKDTLSQVLSGIGLDATEENVHIASILSRSEIDITYESLMEGKVVNKKLDYVLNNLHPSIAAQLIKEGENPLNFHIDQLIEYIDTFNNQYGTGLKDKIASHILEIQDSLSADVREKMMAVYRALHQVNANGGTALGMNIKSGNSLTLGHLLDSAQYYTKTKGKSTFIDASPTENSAPINQQNIRELLAKTNQAPTKLNEDKLNAMLEEGAKTPLDINEYLYTELVLKEATTKLNPHTLKNIPHNVPLPNVLENIKGENLIRSQEIIKEIKDIGANNPAALHFLEKTSIKATLPVLQAVSLLVSQPSQIRNKLDKVKDKLDTEKIPKTPMGYLKNDKVDTTSVTEALEQIMEIPIQEAVEEAPTSVNLKDIVLLQNALKLQSSTDIGAFSLPIRLNNKTETLNMHVQNSFGKEATLVISLTTARFGMVDAYVKADGTNISLYLNNNPLLSQLFETTQALLAQSFTDKGFALKHVMHNGEIADITKEHIEGENYNSITNITRQQIFRIATCFTNYLNLL